MALTPTTDKELGFMAPDFELPDVRTGKTVSYEEIRGEHGTLVAFICNHCPYVVHVREAFVQLANDYQRKGIGFVAISSNDIVNYPDDAPEKMKALADDLNFSFPYLYDETQEVARVYDAACTPDFSVFDANNTCVYRGQMDDSRPGNDKPITGSSLRTVFDLLIAGESVPTENQIPSIGCNIKWKAES